MAEDRGGLFDEWTGEYARLSLRLDRLAPGTVDAWTGPEDWRDAVLREPEPSAADLERAAAELLDRLPAMGYAQHRQDYLSRQVVALQASTRLLQGATMSLREQARLLFDLQVEMVPEEQFARAHEALERALPGGDPLPERLAEYRRRLEVAPEKLPDLLTRVAAHLRARTAEHVALPAGESIEVTLVRNQPWSGYNWYLGNARSRVELNTDLPVHVHTLADLMAHEGYPGHHTEHALRETRQYLRDGHAEYAVQLINTPECVISEGIATAACATVFPHDAELAWTAEHLLPGLDIDMDIEQALAVKRAMWHARSVRGNAAILLHEQGRSVDEVSAYLQRWALLSPREASKALEFIGSPLWRTYTFTYTYGRMLVEPLLRGDDRFAVLERICSEPVYPALLRDWASRSSASA